MSGTSFSTALASRAVALAMLEWIDGGKVGPAPGTENWFRTRAATDEAAAHWPGETLPEKGGFGRLTAPVTGRLAR